MASSKHFSTVILLALFMVAHLADARGIQFFLRKVTKETTTQHVPDKDPCVDVDEHKAASFSNRYLTELDYYDGENVKQENPKGTPSGGSNTPNRGNGKYINHNNNN
ncbi:hypothetical protein SAY86_011186 [Trapa natans]|uniref:Uncharacterized protein n=1 Tax=Trapa natans TaxID=22666 RepID=A0AAN7R690_TRANT|nr:hypothetical protein SAY86_011186 [Trapa natans]